MTVSVEGLGFVCKYGDRYVLILSLWGLGFEDMGIV
jgi:hypothetical protein